MYGIMGNCAYMAGNGAPAYPGKPTSSLNITEPLQPGHMCAKYAYIAHILCLLHHLEMHLAAETTWLKRRFG